MHTGTTPLYQVWWERLESGADAFGAMKHRPV
jgi:hypothetical protein